MSKEKPTANSSDRRSRRDRQSRFHDDDRGVSEILGAILVFGILILLLILIQASAVPAWNQQVEYEHNQRVQEDVQELGSALQDAASDGTDRTTVVEMGVQYPTRPFLFNPPPVNGALEGIPSNSAPSSSNMTVSNVRIVGVGNYPYQSGQSISSPTKAVRYRIDYNQYGNAPVTVVENGVVYNRYDNAVLTMDEGNLVNGSKINLVAVEGRLSESASGPATVRTRATSGPAQTVVVENSNAGQPLRIQVPTLLSASEWETILSDQRAVNGGNVTSIQVNQISNQPYDRLVLELQPGRYSLRMSEVGFGSNVQREPPAYITDIEGGGETVLAGTTTTLTAEVRDKYNNPVANEEVTVQLQSGGGTFLAADGSSLGSGPIQTTTDADGQVSVRYRPANGTNVVRMTGDFPGVPTTAERIDFTVSASSASGGGSSPDSVSAINPGEGAEQVRLSGVSGSQDDVTMTFDNDAPVGLAMTEMRISYYLSDDIGAAATSGTFSYGGNTKLLTVYDDFEPVPGPTFASDGSGGTEVQTIAINDLKQNVKGDFMIVSVVYEDSGGNERRITYFVGIP